MFGEDLQYKPEVALDQERAKTQFLMANAGGRGRYLAKSIVGKQFFKRHHLCNNGCQYYKFYEKDDITNLMIAAHKELGLDVEQSKLFIFELLVPESKLRQKWKDCKMAYTETFFETGGKGDEKYNPINTIEIYFNVPQWVVVRELEIIGLL